MRFCCPVEGGWTVAVSGSQQYARDGGGTLHEYVTGRCESCGSRVLVQPTEKAIAIATERIAAMQAATERAHGKAPASGG